MDLSIPLAGIQSASNSFDSAASAITQAFNKNSTASTPLGDSVDLTTPVAALLKSKLDFMANMQVAIVENETNKSTFSLLA